jgi:hypothetical protein
VVHPYPLSYSGVATRIWQWTVGHEEWNWFTRSVIAGFAIGAACYVVLWWSILAELLDMLHGARGWRAPAWVLRTGIKRPAFGFFLGSIPALTLLILVAIGLHPR